MNKLLSSPDFELARHVKLLRFLPAKEDPTLWKHWLRVAAVRVAQKEWEMYRIGYPAVPPRSRREVRRELKRLIVELEELYAAVVAICQGGSR